MSPLLPPPDPSVFVDRRARVLEALGADAMVLPAAPVLLRGGDGELPYRPDAELYYLTGFREPEAVLVLRGFAEEDRELLFVRDRDPAQEQWTGLRLGVEGVREQLEFAGARPLGGLDSALPGLLEGAERIHARLGSDARTERGVREALRVARARGARKGRGPRGITDPGGILDEMRLRKDPVEIAAIREAVRVSMAGFRAAMEVLGPGVGEWEVEAALTGTFRKEGATGPAFSPIVASGVNACILHYIENGARIRAGDLVLIDAGAEVGLYGGDLTRTLPASGTFSGEQRAVYEVVEAARAAAVERVAPGVEVSAVHEAASEVLTEGLVALGLLEGDPTALREAGAHRRFFPHQTSHWLGLQTHDPGDYVQGGASRRLEPGMVLTVEPGLYLPPAGFFGPGGVGAGHGAPEGRTDPEAAAGPGGPGSGAGEVPPDPGPFAGIGIRIEDDVLVTEDGREVLSRALPTAPDALG